ncbi:MAG TPA: nuclease-related domain-containing protein [Patescibacteria group bacterium]|nr:nuclease-related domain-containing protein [Patescibacteria group bacterium]
MDPLLRLAVIMALCPAPSVLLFFLISRKRRLDRAQAASHQVRRRPAGESFREELERLDEQLNEWLIYLAICPAIVGISAALLNVPGIMVWAGLFGAAVVWSGVCAVKLSRLNGKRAEAELQFEGCRSVAVELDRLAAEGFEIYHDLPFDGFNLHHVLLGPPGLYVIETMTHCQTAMAATAGQPQAEFDGFRVNWPSGSESYGLETAVTRADALAQWLSGSLGETIEATPVLTLPGWAVHCSGSNQSVMVLNSREIGKLCDSRIVRLNEDLIRRICHHLNQKCGARPAFIPFSAD